ncbi:MAG: hypothetical protein JOZ87_11010 [Chloroflexi bacterium]|nr:hypothetical protein [Chloroflexota bacterium]
MRLPDLVAYQTAVQHPSTAFADPQLRGATVTTGNLGLPRAVAGNFAVTYQLRAGARQWAVRCFHREAVDRGSRYAAISQSLARLQVGPLVPIQYLDSGVRVAGAWYPITKMAWLEGRPLNRAVEERLSTPGALADIERRFIETVAELRRLGIAHGDLQHGNVLVDGAGTLRLVDYDGMFVPALHGRPASESGDPNYQHPRRGVQFDAELDRFAAIVIVVALRALAVAPHLWQTYTTGDNLLFRRADLVDPSASALFHDLAALAATRELSRRLAAVCQDDYARVPTLDEFLNAGRPTFKPRHVAVLNTLYAAPRRATHTTRPHSWKLRRASVQTAVAFSPDGQVLATADRDGRIILRDATTGRTRRSVRLPRGAGNTRALAFTASGDLLAVTTHGSNLRVWDVVARRERFACSVGGRTLRGVALSSNAACLVASGDDRTLHCWKVASGRLAGSFAPHGSVTALAVSRDGRSIAAAGPRLALTVWHAASGRIMARLPAGRDVACLAFGADASHLVVGMPSGQVRAWRLRAPAAEPPLEMASSRSRLETITLTADGSALAATGRDGTIWLRRLSSPARSDGSLRVRVISSSYRIFDWLRRVALL